ncbi:MAG: type IIA DNA topoisomerase subunit B [Bacteroidetes bacterium]|uniref:DNA topoisomerase (ATP-hydrolyzing) n=1 Tax=Candidatus Merdivivens pullicola TaxID=2840872 RepID=A0A9D9IJA4_9BACT|nr:type IIA DNA topoisomerase subunit B [Candidatus Merdivivens pullicola]
MSLNDYTDDNIITLEWNEHIRRRAGMYIGRLGNGDDPDDGIYVLLKEIIDNAIDEFISGHGRNIIIEVGGSTASVRDFGHGIPLNSLVRVVTTLNTGAKFDDNVYAKSVGLNGVGSKAVNALSSEFYIESFRDGQSRYAVFSQGKLLDTGTRDTREKNGTYVRFTPDTAIFGEFSFNTAFVETMVKNYSYLNKGLNIRINGKDFTSKNGLLDLVNDSVKESSLLYSPIHLSGDDIEVVIAHDDNYGENIASFVNGQNTRDGGTHLTAFKEAVVKTVKEFYKKDFDSSDIRQGIVGAISIRIHEPNFESQTKIKLGSTEMWKDGPTVRNYVNNFIKTNLDNYLHINREIADAMLKKIQASEKERKEMSGIQKIAKERLKKASVHNKKLCDCRYHYGDKNELGEESSIFITEGDSASGTITKIRNANTQAVFSLKGKPLNCYKASKKLIYENEEFNLLVSALGIREDTENLRYNNVIIATDADDDGMHIRLLLTTFFLKFFPDVIRSGHVYILQTPLFRVKNKKETCYCYSIEEKEAEARRLKTGVEITRFKGLGEISDHEFRHFIGKDMRLDKLSITDEDSIQELMEFYMGDNTMDRQKFITDNLRSEVELEDVM